MLVNFIAISPSREDQNSYTKMSVTSPAPAWVVVVQKCVELHGSSIEIASIPWNGTTVTILLPKVT